MTVKLYLSRNCMKIGHGSDLGNYNLGIQGLRNWGIGELGNWGIGELKEFYLFNFIDFIL